MKLSEILKAQGMFSQDIKIRFKNKQIFIDGEIVTDQTEVDFELEPEEKKIPIHEQIIDAGDFIFFNIAKDHNMITLTKLIGFENLSSCNIKNDLTDLMKEHHVIKVSKRELFVIKKMLK